MPISLSTRPVRRLAAALAGAACLCAAAPVAAQACASTPTSQPFAQFGDSASYSRVPGGSFEPGSAPWAMSESAIVGENESYRVAGGSHSLEIRQGGEAVSPPMCVNSSYPTLRFFARQMPSRYGWGVLAVSVRWTAADGSRQETVVGSTQGETSWSPGPIMNLADALPIWSGSPDLQVQLVFRAYAGGADWEIDDVYADPYSR